MTMSTVAALVPSTLEMISAFNLKILLLLPGLETKAVGVVVISASAVFPINTVTLTIFGFAIFSYHPPPKSIAIAIVLPICPAEPVNPIDPVNPAAPLLPVKPAAPRLPVKPIIGPTSVQAVPDHTHKRPVSVAI